MTFCIRFSLHFAEGELPDGEKDDGIVKLSKFAKEANAKAAGSFVVVAARVSQKVAGARPCHDV